MITNSTIEAQLNHRTIREFTDQPVSDEIMDTLYAVANRTATSRGLQSVSIIRVKDPAKRAKLTEIGEQEYVGRAPIYIMFIVDARRNAAILREKGLDDSRSGSMKVFLEAFTDACLMAQNVTVAAESLGLGANYLGSIHNDDAGVIETLGLPKYTYPVLGMTLGYPNVDPQVKPRIPVSLRVMEDGYQDQDSWLEALSDYDQEMTTYYDTRNLNTRSDTYTNTVVNILGPDAPKRAVDPMTMVRQGFQMG